MGNKKPPDVKSSGYNHKPIHLMKRRISVTNIIKNDTVFK